MNVNFDNNIPIYIQLLDYMKIYIISDFFSCGSKLPSVRDLANMFKVNPNTMQKALTELEDLKLIYTERTNGKYVTKNKKTIEKVKNEYAKEIANKYFESMNKIGIDKARAINYLYERKIEDGTIRD